MIYIVYGLSGPLKRLLIDPIGEKERQVGVPKITINKRGVYNRPLERYDKKDLTRCLT